MVRTWLLCGKAEQMVDVKRDADLMSRSDDSGQDRCLRRKHEKVPCLRVYCVGIQQLIPNVMNVWSLSLR